MLYSFIGDAHRILSAITKSKARVHRYEVPKEVMQGSCSGNWVGFNGNNTRIQNLGAAG